MARFELILSCRDDDELEAVRRLRAALKTLLRAYGLRCVELRRVTAECTLAPGRRPYDAYRSSGVETTPSAQTNRR